MHKGFYVLLVVGIAALSFPTLAKTGWDPAACWLVSHEDRRVECGYMRVKENRDSAASPETAFPVVIMRSAAEVRKDDPVVILGAGGPGIGLDMDQSSIDGYWDYYDWVLDAGRDLILLDPRGVGAARPALTCPEVTQQMEMFWGSRFTADLENRLGAELYSRCQKRWAKEGVSLEHYNTRSTAQDIAELREALKIKQWNLYGTSYAATLAMTIMRDYPQGVRSVILDSVQAPDVRFFQAYAANFHSPFQTLFDACAKDFACTRDFPDLTRVLERVVRRLNTHPIVVTVAHPLSLDPFPLIINGDMLVGILRSAMYDENNVAELPMLIYAVDRGSVDMLAPYARGSFQDDLDPGYADGVHLSVSCREEIPFNDMTAAARGATAFPMVAGAIRGVVDYYKHACAAWGVPAAPQDEIAPVRSAIPTLIFGGEWDPIIPSKWAQAAATHLEQAYVFEFPVTAHDVMAADYCAVILAGQFLDGPGTAPYDECIDEPALIEFRTLPFKPVIGTRGGNAARARPIARHQR